MQSQVFLEYNYGIMLKWLIVLAIAALFSASVSSQPYKATDYDQQPAYQRRVAIILAPPHEQNYSTTDQPKTNPYAPKWYAPLKRPEWWLVGLGLGTLGFLWRQIYLFQNTAKRELRAYLCISQARLNFGKDKSIKAQINVKNGGQTPAYKVRVWSRIIIREHPLLEPLGYPGEGFTQAEGIIAPDGEHIIVTMPISGPDADLGRVYHPGHALYAHGECSYLDIFGRVTHVLGFRLIFGGPGQISTATDPEGNSFARLCPDVAGNEEWDEKPNKKGKKAN